MKSKTQFGEFVDSFAVKHAIPKAKADEYIRSVFEEIIFEVSKNDKENTIAIPSVGTFSVRGFQKQKLRLYLKCSDVLKRKLTNEK